MSSLREKIRHELSELIPVTVFFFISFQLLAVTEALMLEEYGIHPYTFIAATVGALIVAKVVVIADHFAFVNRFPEKPLMYNVVWKTAIYFVASLVVRYAEHLIHFWRQTRDVGAANRRLFEEIIWPHFWGVQLWLLILLLVYCALRELIRALGRDRVVKMFFSSPARDVLLWLLCAGAMAGGCARGNAPRAPAASHDASTPHIDPRRVQSATMSFADRYLAAVADVYDRAQHSAKTPDARIMAQRQKILAGIGATGNAVDPNPVIGLMDMAVMVTLASAIAHDPWVAEMFGREAADAIAGALKVQEQDIWRTAGEYLSAAQIEELHQLAARWRTEHPEQRYVAGARLADFPESKTPSGGAVQQVAGSVFGLVTLDPFHGLDPALKEVAESRVLAERLFFYLRHAPIMMSWQADGLFEQLLAQPKMVQLFADTATVAGSTTRFSDATSRFSDASAQVAQTVEKFRLGLPEQQASLVAELNTLVARQREGALQQATTQVSVQRDATIEQLGKTIATQQDLMTRNLQGLTDQSIDRLYQRVRSLVLITVGVIFLAFVLYRMFVAGRVKSAMREAATR